MKHRLVNTARQNIDKKFLRPEQDNPIKPNGLWYGEDDSWLRAVIEYRLHDELKPNTFEITLDENRICKLHSLEDLSAFTTRYSIKGDSENHKIDWRKVADDWAGVEISKKALFEESEDKSDAFLRRDGKPTSPAMLWIDAGWDIGSGCLWDASAIIDSKKLQRTDPLLAVLATTTPQSAVR